MTVRIPKGWGKGWEYRGSRTYIQRKRYEALINDGLRPFQAKHFVFFNIKHAYMRRFRSAIRRGEAGRSQSSVWALWRKCYNDAIEKARRGDRGGYEPLRKPYDPNKPHKKLNQYGEIDYSHTREAERKRRASAKTSTQSRQRKPVADNRAEIQAMSKRLQAISGDPIYSEGKLWGKRVRYQGRTYQVRNDGWYTSV